MSIQQTGVLTFKFKGFKEVCGFFHQALTFKYTAAPPLWMFDIIAATSASEQERRFRDAAKEEMNRVDEMEGVDQLVVTPPQNNQLL